MKYLIPLILVTGFLLFNPHQAVLAEVTGPPDITTKVPIPNLIKFGNIGTDNEGNSFLEGLKPESNRPLGGFLGFQGSNEGKPVVDEPKVYRNLGDQLEIALPYLTPDAIHIQEIKENYSHTATSTICFASDNENKQAFPIKERIIIPARGLNKVLQNSIPLSGLLAPNFTITKDIYEHLAELFPNILGSILAKPECDEPPPSRVVRKALVPTTEAEVYNVPLDKLPVYLLDKWINVLLSVVGKKCSETNCSADVSPSMFAYIKSKTPYIKEILTNLTNDPSGKPIGALATFKPESIIISNEHGEVSGQTIEQTVGSNSDPIKDVGFKYFGAGTIDTYDRFTNCAIHPDSLQSTKLGYSCNFSDNDVTADRALGGGIKSDFTFSDPKFVSLNKEINDATNGKIPACVLEGVKYIETGEQTDFSGACPVNICSAAGPYQVTTGAAPASGGGWDTHCTQCGPLWSDGSKDCPDGWPNDWPKIQDKDNPSPCSNTAAAARRAVEMLQEKAVIRCESLDTTRSIQEQKTAIITAAGSYYGANTPIPRLGGCSYGEFVYKHCDPDYKCGTANVDLRVKWEQCQAQKKL